MFKDFAWNSPYTFAENDVIRSIDLDGLEKWIVHLYYADDNKTVTKMVISRYLDVEGKVLENNLKSKGVKITVKDVMIMYHSAKDSKIIKAPTFEKELSKTQKLLVEKGKAVKTPNAPGFENKEYSGDKFTGATSVVTTGNVVLDIRSETSNEDNASVMAENIESKPAKIDPNNVFSVNVVFSTKGDENTYGTDIVDGLQATYPNATVKTSTNLPGLEKQFKGNGGVAKDKKTGQPNAINITKKGFK